MFSAKESLLTDEWVHTQKKTTAIERTQTIELVISEENDYGIGNGRLFCPSESCGRLFFAY
jgi:hypothetical protein